jgi:putative hydrolase of the HAD superfamily
VLLVTATARTFRSSSLRKLEVLPNILRLLKELEEYPMAIVSDGQRVFSKLELKYLGLDKYFKFVHFSSDFGHKKARPQDISGSGEDAGAGAGEDHVHRGLL